MELRLTHPDDACLTIDVGECQTQYLAAAQSRCVQEHDRQAQDLRAQRRVRRGRERDRARQHPGDLLGFDEDRRPIGLRAGEVQRVGHEAA